MSKDLLFTFILISLSTALKSQLTYKVTSLPDSAAVYQNEELVGHTPLYLKYRWRDNVNGEIRFEVKKEGYRTANFKLNEKPMDFDEREHLILEPDFDRIEQKGQPLIDFDRLLVDFRDDQIIGKRQLLKGTAEDVKWSGSIKVGDESYGEEFIDIATDMGFNTLRAANSQLFSEEQSASSQIPRFLVGARLIELDIQMQEEEVKHNIDPLKCKTALQMEWNVLDKKNSKVIMTAIHPGTFQFRQSLYQKANYIQKAFVNSMLAFLGSERFQDLVFNAEGYLPEENQSETNLETLQIDQPAPLEFDDFSDLVKATSKACVSVITDGGFGSGAIIDPNGLILTAYHVVEGVNKIEVKFASGIQLPAELVKFSKQQDLAILRINGSGYPALILDLRLDPSLGEDVFTIGTPADLDLGQSISKGIVSGRRKVEGQIYLQMDMAVSPGNSGGPLLNQQGEVIGIVLSKIVEEGVEGIGFAVPSKEIVEALNLDVE